MTSAVYFSGALGDAVLHMALVRGLAEYLGERLLLIDDLPPAANALLADEPYLARVVSSRDILLGPRAARVPRFADLLRAHGVTALYFFNFRTFVARAALRAGVGTRVGFVHWHALPRALFFTHWAGVRRGERHPRTVKWMLQVFERNAMAVFPRYPGIGAGAADAPPPTPMLALGLNGSGAQKRYPHWRRLVERLEAVLPRPLDYLLFGAGDVAPIAADLQARTPVRGRYVDLTQRPPDIVESCRQLRRCDGYVGNDSFGLHLAIACKLPAVGLFWFARGMDYVPWLASIEPRYPRLGSHGLDPDVVEFRTVAALRGWCPRLFEAA